MAQEATAVMPATEDALQIEPALARATLLLETQPAAALAAVEAILAAAPALPPAELLACQALRRLGQPDIAMARLVPLARAHRRVPAVTWELALAASAAGDSEAAIAALENLTRQLPAVPDGWFLLAAELREAGQADAAWRADLAGIQAAAQDAELIGAALAMNEGRLDDSEAMLAARLQRLPDDASAHRLRGEIHWRRGDMVAALAPVQRAIEIAPGFDLAREFLIRLLMQSNRLVEALQQAEILAQSPVKSPSHDMMLASVLVRLGEHERARDIYRHLLARQPGQPQVWQNLGHVLKTLGQQADAVEAYREAVARQPTMGEAWWSLANLKTVRLGAADIAAMIAALEALASDAANNAEDILHLHFSLGKAFEDAGDDAAAFSHYDRGNRLRRTMLHYDADGFSAQVATSAAVFGAGFIAERGDEGCPARDPIFIVGLPRSGSTLVEQIVASHSQVEGTMELPEMMMIASRLQARVDAGEFADFGAMIASLTPADRMRLGEEYLERTRVHRKTGKPLFIDKMPNNWEHVGLITLILPNARIIDTRRHPVGNCFSAWKQHFARGQAFTYDLVELARYYRDYTMLMAAFDDAAPGRVHCVVYERMVTDTRREIERLLAYLGLPFEDACLSFWQNDRAVRTASSEQVRTPIFTEAIDHWRRFEPWLGPLMTTLGPVVDRYPDNAA